MKYGDLVVNYSTFKSRSAILNMTLQSAGDLLRRAVELDTAMKYSESLVCYEEGIQVLIRLMPGKSTE